MSNIRRIFLEKRNIFMSFIIVFLLVYIILSPSKFITAGLNGISAWAFNVLPAVLPFMILTQILINLKTMDKLCKPFSKPMEKIYGVPGLSLSIFLTSIMAGYPVGSKMIADLYESGQISRQDAFRMSSFCSNSGPMFIVGVVGINLFKNSTWGYILLISHILSALINGLIYRKIIIPDEKTEHKKNNYTLSFGDIISSCSSAILNVCAIITLFFIIIEAISPILTLLPYEVSGLIGGLFEITRGCIDLSKIGGNFILPLVSFVITFGGFSTILQSMSILKKTNMSTTLFALQKLTQGIISCIITLIFCLII